MTSSNIEAVGYDAKSRTARVKFRSGATYDYADVPPIAFENLRSAESPSGHLGKYWKGVFTATRLNE